MPHHVLSLLVENKPGALSRVAGLFARRGFNIETLTVGPTDQAHLSRITLTVDGETNPIDQIVKQLDKLVNVLMIEDLEGENSVVRELALFKVARSPEVERLALVFAGRIVASSPERIIIEISGSPAKISAFEELVEKLDLIEMMRSGAIASRS